MFIVIAPLLAHIRVGDDQLGGTVLRYAQPGPTLAFLSALMGHKPDKKDPGAGFSRFLFS